MSGEPPIDRPRIRHAAIPDDAWLVVRGVASIEPETSRRQAELFRRRFEGWGRYGLSAFYARSDDEVLDLGEDRLDAFATLFVYRLADVIDAGFEVVPTYRSPHVTITFYDDVDVGVARLLAVPHRTVSNPAFREESMKIDLFVDLNTEDETGFPWTYLDQAADPSLVVPGRLIVVGSGSAVAIAEVIDVSADGLVHVRPLPGPVTEQRLTNGSQRV